MLKGSECQEYGNPNHGLKLVKRNKTQLDTTDLSEHCTILQNS